MAEHRGAVYRFARRLTGDDAAAEDVLQDTFLDALKGLHTLSSEAAARPWLLSIARNRAHRGARRRAGEPSAYEPIESLETLGLDAGWGDASPETEVARAEDGAALERALATLADGDQEILMLRDVDGLSGEETATVLGLSLAGMKSRLHRARLRLMAALHQKEATR